MVLPRWGKISPGIESPRWSGTRGLGNMADTQSDAEIIFEEDLGGARVSGNARDACGAYFNKTLHPPDLKYMRINSFYGVMRGITVTQTQLWLIHWHNQTIRVKAEELRQLSRHIRLGWAHRHRHHKIGSPEKWTMSNLWFMHDSQYRKLTKSQALVTPVFPPGSGDLRQQHAEVASDTHWICRSY